MPDDKPRRQNRRYNIVVTRSAEKELSKLNRITRARIGNAIDQLRLSPRPRGSEKIAGSENQRRIRVGDFRVIYTIDDRVVTITVIRVGNRRDVYRG